MKGRDIVAYYRARAQEYDRIYFRNHPGKLAELADEAERLRHLVTAKSVLDIPCGTGYWTHIMAVTAESIVAADIAPEMLTEARTKPYRCRVDFLRADLGSMPFPRESFDIVALGFWLSHHPRQAYERLFADVMVPLKKGGRIWMIENQLPEDNRQSPRVGEDEFGNNLVLRFLDDGSEHVIIKNYFATAEQLRELLEPHFRIERLTFGRFYWSAVLVRP